MTFRSKLLDRETGVATLAVATAAVLMASLVVTPLVASASIGASSGTSSPLSTAAPDLRTAAVENIAAKRVRFCFDQPVANFSGNEGNFHLNGYNDDQMASGTSIGTDANPNCLLVEFANSDSAVTQYTVATTDPSAVQNTALSNDSVPGATALTGINLGSTGLAGRTTGPDLAGAAPDGSLPNDVLYTYDEVLDHTYSGTGCDPTKFGYWETDGDRVVPALSCTVSPGSTVARASFTSTTNAARFFSLTDAVMDLGGDSNSGQSGSPLGSTTTLVGCPLHASADCADLSSVNRINDDTVDYSFDEGDGATVPVAPTCDPTKFFVFEEDGTPYAGSGSCDIRANTATSLVIRISGFGTTDFSAFETPTAAVVVGGVTGSVINTDGARLLGTSNEASGFTDAPDLESADFDTSFFRVTYNFDENVDDSTDDPTKYCVVDNNDDEDCTGSNVSITANQVEMAFTSPVINTAVGAYVEAGAATDFASNTNVQAAVGRGTAPSQGTIQFSSSNVSVSESAGNCPGGGAQLSVTRSGSTGTASVNFATSNGTANASSDYTSTSGTLNWANGDSAPKVICVPILQDSIAESSETFTVSLSGVTGGSLGSPSTATVSITDDEGGSGSLSFSSSTYITSEASNATITVVRSGGLSGTVSVNFTTSNGSAIAGLDYTATSGTLTFGSGVSQQSFTVPVINDVVDESDETVNLSLSNPSGGAGLTSPSSAVLTIVDNDTVGSGTLALDASSYTVNEGAGSVTVTVLRTGGSTGTVTVQYAVSSGSATSGIDFGATSGTLTFLAGDVSEAFTIPIINDGNNESDETATITLSSPGGGANLGSPSTATLTIIDDDESSAVDSRVSLNYRGRIDRFRGRVSIIGGSAEEVALCRAGRTVVLKKNGTVLDSATSGTEGRWRLDGFPDANGRYIAVVRRRVRTLTDGSTLICRRGQSAPLFL